jgi:GTP-binding protein HflX
MESVDKLLNEIGLDEIPRLVVFNKADLVNPLWAKVIAARFNGVVCSALDAGTFADLLREIEKRVWNEENSGLRVRRAEESG